MDSTSPSAHNLVGATLGKYVLTELLGSGGMAEVYRAFQSGLNRSVAIKVLHPHLARAEGLKDRFMREARAVAALRHPNIIQIYDFDFDTDGDWYYMVMEHIGGGTLTERLQEIHQRGQIMLLAEAYDLFKAIGSALHYAHEADMVHRDIKPSNIMFTEKGEPILTDFGIVRMMGATQFTRTGASPGTPSYMSPEQAMGEGVDKRSDIYSLGVMLYEVVTGRLPYEAETPFGMIMKHVNEPLTSPLQLNPNLPPSIIQVLENAMAKNPADRYQTVREMILGLGQAIDPQLTTPGFQHLDRTNPMPVAPAAASAPAATGQPESRGSSKTPLLVGSGVLLIIAVVALIIGFVWMGPADSTTAETEQLALVQQTIERQPEIEQATPAETAVDIALAAAETPTQAATATVPPIESSPTPTSVPTDTATPLSDQIVAVDSPTATITNTPVPPTSTPSPTPLPTHSPTPSPSPTSTATPTQPPPTPTSTSTATPTPTPSPIPTVTPTRPSPTPTPAATAIELISALSGRLIYVSDRDGDFEIYLKYLGTDRPDLKLTDNSVNDWFPDWSADGSRIIFTSNRAAGDSNHDLYTMQSDGSGQNIYVNTPAWDEYGNWEPGSDRIVFASTEQTNGVPNAELFQRNSDGSLTRLTFNQGDDRNPDWDSTGEIFYASNASGNWEIYVLPANAASGAAQPRNLTNHPAVDEDPAISANGSQILFVRKTADTNGNGQVGDGDLGNIYLMNRDGSGVRALTSTNLDSSPAWSPDGAWIIFSRGFNAEENSGNLYALRLSDNSLVQITDDEASANWGAAWVR